MIVEASVLERISSLVIHLLKILDPSKPETEDWNDEVNVICSHNLLAGTDLVAAAREMRALASGSQAKKPFYSAAINPDRAHGKALTDEQAEEAARRLLKALGFTDDHQWFLVKHCKKGRVHYHVVANRIDPMSLKAVHLSHNYRKQELVARELEVLFDLPAVPGAFTHGPGIRPPRSRRNRKEEQQAKRTAIPLRDIDSDLTWAWRNSATGAEFLSHLELRGYQLAKGERRDLVVLDPIGGVHSPSRRLGIRAAELRAKTRDLAEIELPPIAGFREELARISQMGESALDDAIATPDQPLPHLENKP